MTPDALKDLCFSIGKASADAAQAGAEARQPEIDALRRERDELVKEIEKIEQQLDYGQFQTAHKIALAALSRRGGG